MSREYGSNGHTVMLSFLLGAMTGAAAVLILAPQARRESAQRIRDFSNDLREKATDYLETTKDKVSTGISRGRDFLDEKRSLIQSAVDAGKEAYKREKTPDLPE